VAYTQNFRMGAVEVPQAPKGVGCGEGVSPSTQGEGSGEGLSLPRKLFVLFFLLKMLYFDAFLTRLFLKSYANGVEVLTFLNPVLGTPLFAGWKMHDLENYGPNLRAGKWKRKPFARIYAGAMFQPYDLLRHFSGPAFSVVPVVVNASPTGLAEYSGFMKHNVAITQQRFEANDEQNKHECGSGTEFTL